MQGPEYDVFTWDEEKSERCQRERGFGFEDAVKIFENGFIEAEDRRRDYGEQRFVTIGQVDDIVPRGTDCMASVKRTNKQIHDRPAHIDSEKVASFTDADIARFAREDDSDTSDLRDFRYVPPRTDVRALRERLGLSQAEFARRYRLSVRTVQQWEQDQREPSEPARVLLLAIDRDPHALERALR